MPIIVTYEHRTVKGEILKTETERGETLKIGSPNVSTTTRVSSENFLPVDSTQSHWTHGVLSNR